MTNERVEITKDSFGDMVNQNTKNTEPVTRYTIKSKNITVQVITYGATITSIQTPDKNGKLDDIVLGFDDIEGYQSEVNPYFGATIGRYANRLGKGSFQLDGKTYTVTKNLPNAQLHGGLIGFDKVNWNSYVNGNQVIFTYLSLDGEEGYPGDLLCTISYEILEEKMLKIKYEAACTKSTVVNLTNHSYFNLAGYGAGSEGVYNTMVSINADKIAVLDKDLVATGELECVAGTGYDLRIPRNLGNSIKNIPERGYDFNYCLNKFCSEGKGLTFAARAVEPNSGRYMELHTDQPGIQFYTGNFIPNGVGKNGTKFDKQSAFCFETQNFPNSVNISSFPSATLRPGERYDRSAIFVFGVITENN